jgi:hypothetical protein
MLHREVGNTIGGQIALGFLLQTLSFIVLGTLLGAAYAVTMKTDSKHSRPINTIEFELNKNRRQTTFRKPSRYDQKIINDLERQINSLRKKSNYYDVKNIRLMGKVELLTVKNRALSNQLRYLDDLASSLTSTPPALKKRHKDL